LGLVNRVITTMIARMSKEDKERLVEEMTEQFLSNMTAEEKQKIISSIVEKFLADMSVEDKKKIMSELTPKMMENFDMTVIMPQMLMAMMGQKQDKDEAASVIPTALNITSKSKQGGPKPKGGTNEKTE